jgi:hypothetical protein
MHSPAINRKTGAFDEWKGYLRKRASISHYRFAVPADCGIPSCSKMDALGAGI